MHGYVSELLFCSQSIFIMYKIEYGNGEFLTLYMYKFINMFVWAHAFGCCICALSRDVLFSCLYLCSSYEYFL